MARKRYYSAQSLNHSKIVFAICQIETDGKHKTLVGDRNSFGWKDIGDVKARVAKSIEIVDALNRLPDKKIDIIVFPEYSLPIEKVISPLREKANQYKQIIIVGGENILDKETNKIFNNGVIILPDNKKNIWVTKRMLSAWEHGYVDEPIAVQSPVLTWMSTEGKKYWINVCTCLDFNLVKKEYTKGGGLFVVPMCSPDVVSFRGWADDLMRLEGGTATILCNGVGKLAIGSSSLVTMTPDGKPFKPAFELPESKEAIAVFEIDCKQLEPPKKTNPDFKYPLGKTFFYSLISIEGTISLKTLEVREKDVLTRGIINPAIFESLDKKMRMAFLSVENFWELVDKLKNQDFEVLAILGQQDVLVTHLHENRYDMIYDVKKVINWKSNVTRDGKSEHEIIKEMHDRFPFFRVDVYFKVLGAEIPASQSSLDSMPTLDERVQIIKLGSNWNDEQVTEEEKARFLRRGWILKPTDRRPGEINSIMTVSLEHLGPEIEAKQIMFEEKVLPPLVRKHIVTSAYRGRSQNLGYDYILRIWASLEQLYSLIEELHKLASEARVAINTSTYVVLKQLSNLSLEKAVLSPALTPEETTYRNNHIMPKLRNGDRDKLRSLSKESQSEYIELCRAIQDSFSEIQGNEWFRRRSEETEEKMLEGLLNTDFELLKGAYIFFHDRVETKILKDTIDEVTDEEFSKLKSLAKVPSQKARNQLNYLERINVVIKLIESKETLQGNREALEGLLKTTILRNAIIHGNYDKITLTEFVKVLSIYCNFIFCWDK